MKVRAPYRLPEDKERLLHRAIRLEWATLGLMASVIAVVYLAMGSSQTMKAAWIEDLLSLVPPLSFLVAMRYRDRAPTAAFPYGYRRAVIIAFLCAATALTLFGLFILFDSVMKLATQEHPSIGAVRLFGRDVWQGWVMIAALAYSALPPVVLGRMKLPLATALHEKTLFADADMNKADWMTAVAGILGIVGIAAGWWWADGAAAGLISVSIVKDGVHNLTNAVEDLMDARPRSADDEDVEAIPGRIVQTLRRLPWVADADVRLREEGHVLAGEAFVVPRDADDLVERLRHASEAIHALDWRIYDVVVTAVPSLRPDEDRGDG